MQKDLFEKIDLNIPPAQRIINTLEKYEINLAIIGTGYGLRVVKSTLGFFSNIKIKKFIVEVVRKKYNK